MRGGFSLSPGHCSNDFSFRDGIYSVELRCRFLILYYKIVSAAYFRITFTFGGSAAVELK